MAPVLQASETDVAKPDLTLRRPVSEWYALADAGHIEGRWEVIDGRLEAEMGQSPRHMLAIMVLMDIFVRAYGAKRIRIQGPMRLSHPDSTWSEPEPDIVVTKQPAGAYKVQHPGPTDVLLAVEVADTSLAKDLRRKSDLNARSGIEVMWILDLANERLHVHSSPTPTGYGEKKTFGVRDTITLPENSAISVTVAQLLSED